MGWAADHTNVHSTDDIVDHIIASFEQPSLCIGRLGCAAHQLQLAIQENIKSQTAIHALINKISKIVAKGIPKINKYSLIRLLS